MKASEGPMWQMESAGSLIFLALVASMVALALLLLV